ncbi:MAG: fibronectin type III domain-containing protein [bacterium]
MKKVFHYLSAWTITLSFTLFPSLLIISKTYALDIALAWKANQNVAGYKIYYKAASSGEPYDGTGAQQGNSPVDAGNVTSYILTGLDDGKTYFLAVTAYDVYHQKSDYSKEVSPLLITGISSATSDGSYGSGCFIAHLSSTHRFP